MIPLDNYDRSNLKIPWTADRKRSIKSQHHYTTHTPQSAWQLSHTTTHWAAAVLHIHHNLLGRCLTPQPTGEQLSHTTTHWTAAVLHIHHNLLGSCLTPQPTRQQLCYTYTTICLAAVSHHNPLGSCVTPQSAWQLSHTTTSWAAVLPTNWLSLKSFRKDFSTILLFTSTAMSTCQTRHIKVEYFAPGIWGLCQIYCKHCQVNKKDVILFISKIYFSSPPFLEIVFFLSKKVICGCFFSRFYMLNWGKIIDFSSSLLKVAENNSKISLCIKH